MRAITPERNQQELQEEGGTDYGFAFGDAGRFRVAVFKQKDNVAIVLRLIPSKILTFEEIGLPEICRALCRRTRGLFLVTGPTGCGKTTTLATMLDYINKNLDRHIVTIEDPIEYYHNHQKCIVNQRAVGVDVPSFSEALRRVLRQDPDVILVGEFRDLETMESGIRAAETGHLVFATLHTTGCQGTINRIVDAFPHEQQEQIRVQMSTNLIATLSQVLLPRIPKGMVAAYEFMVTTPAIANLVRESKTYRIDSAIQTGRKYGMQLLDEHLWSLYESGQISAEDCSDQSRHPGQMQDKIDTHRRGLDVSKMDVKPGEEAAPVLRTS
jgi:twitching motility protein PilT